MRVPGQHGRLQLHPRPRITIVPGGEDGVSPPLAAALARAIVVAFTARRGERPELRLARVALPETDH